MSVITPERLLKLAYHYPDLHNIWYLITIATLTELNLIEDIPAILHFALRQQLFEFCNDEETVLNNEFIYKLAEDSISSSKMVSKMYNTGINIPDILIPHTYANMIPLTYKYSKGKDIRKKQQFIVDQARETILKCVSFVGLPKTINALTILKSVTPTSLTYHNVDTPKRPNYVETGDVGEETIDGKVSDRSLNLDIIQNNLLKGAELWSTSYSGNVKTKIRKQMLNVYPDLWYYVYHNIYSVNLQFDKILTNKKTSLVLLGCLIPQDLTFQIKGYLKSAINNGATKEQVNQTINLILEICEWKTGHNFKDGIESIPKL
ncbi:unnamed protein product [Candida verbasci]|uniref:Carboxymuconolactone decarboxylase-like domain-containing protein n=1 Tax=Candida verbasci TaxID=1227364 RepID=A0A9W4TWL5_9ASCO|nr:unnamed protein product [Candida verbasci]